MALNATTGEMIAVKQVEMPKTQSDRANARQHIVVDALKAESDTLKVLDHPHIVQYLGIEQSADFLSIFLEYVPGGSVNSCMQRYGRFSDDVVKSFTSHILDGLKYLHKTGVLHRDLKGDNILVDDQGVCKISDFGISKRIENIHGEVDGTLLTGSVYWMAPEIILNAHGYSSKIDIWSLGCVVLEMWAGRRPWDGSDNIYTVINALGGKRQAPPVPDDVLLGPLGEDFRQKCFAIEPAERASAAELFTHPYLLLPPSWRFPGFASLKTPTTPTYSS